MVVGQVREHRLAIDRRQGRRELAVSRFGGIDLLGQAVLGGFEEVEQRGELLVIIVDVEVDDLFGRRDRGHLFDRVGEAVGEPRDPVVVPTADEDLQTTLVLSLHQRADRLVSRLAILHAGDRVLVSRTFFGDDRPLQEYVRREEGLVEPAVLGLHMEEPILVANIVIDARQHRGVFRVLA